MRYAPEAVSSLVDATARDFLTTQGLPSEHLLFGARDPDLVRLESAASGRQFLRVGVVGNAEDLCIDIATGEVVATHRSDGSVWHVNADIVKYAAALEAFTSRFPFYELGSDPESWENAANQFRDVLIQIDPTAFSEDPGYWYTILNDIAIGDYSDE